MPVICAFVDLHSISLLLYKSTKEYWFKNFPYVYSNDLFSSSFSEDAFYSALFTTFCSEHDLKLTDCDILVTGFLEPPALKMPVTLSKSLYEVFSQITDGYPILVNNYSIFTADFCFSNATIKPIQRPGEHVETEEENYYANLNLYPQLIPNELAVQVDIDRNIAALLLAKTKFPIDKPIIFCGSRFTEHHVFAELDYLLMLDIIKNSGIYEIKRDVYNSAILEALLKLHDPKVKLDLIVVDEGILVSSLYSLECMVGSSEGTSQLVNLEKDRILVVPLEVGQSTDIMIKSHDLGTVEKKITGGKVGLIFDTRDNKSFSQTDIKVFSQSLKTFEEVLKAKKD